MGYIADQLLAQNNVSSVEELAAVQPSEPAAAPAPVVEPIPIYTQTPAPAPEYYEGSNTLLHPTPAEVPSIGGTSAFDITYDNEPLYVPTPGPEPSIGEIYFSPNISPARYAPNDLLNANYYDAARGMDQTAEWERLDRLSINKVSAIDLMTARQNYVDFESWFPTHYYEELNRAQGMPLPDEILGLAPGAGSGETTTTPIMRDIAPTLHTVQDTVDFPRTVPDTTQQEIDTMRATTAGDLDTFETSVGYERGRDYRTQLAYERRKADLSAQAETLGQFQRAQLSREQKKGLASRYENLSNRGLGLTTAVGVAFRDEMYKYGLKQTQLESALQMQELTAKAALQKDVLEAERTRTQNQYAVADARFTAGMQSEQVLSPVIQQMVSSRASQLGSTTSGMGNVMASAVGAGASSYSSYAQANATQYRALLDFIQAREQNAFGYAQLKDTQSLQETTAWQQAKMNDERLATQLAQDMANRQAQFSRSLLSA